MGEQRYDVDKKQMGGLPYIIAVDFDGTLVSDGFPNIGEPNVSLFDQCKTWQNMGYKLILWTCRDGKQLDEAIDFCADQGLVFHAYNRNIPEVINMFQNDTRKVYANVYIDDKNLTPHVPSFYKYNPKEDFDPWRLNPVLPTTS